jgi:hypothetical protein
MRQFYRFLVLVVLVLSSAGAEAQLVRTWVSTVGSDSNPCSRDLPCRTFGAAITAVGAGGEVVVLDSGGYGPVTVTKSVALISPPGIHAAIAPTSGPAITVNVDNARVVVRGLYLNGRGGNFGIHFTGAAGVSGTVLHVESTVIAGFTSNGINFARNGILFVSNTIVRNCGQSGIYITGSAGAPSWATVTGTLVEHNGFGLLVDNAEVMAVDVVASTNSNEGFFVRGNTGETAILSLERCLAVLNAGVGMAADNNGGTALLTVSNSASNRNGWGIYTAGTGDTARVTHSTVTLNRNDGFIITGGVFESAGNNTVRGNGTDVFGTITTTFAPI